MSINKLSTIGHYWSTNAFIGNHGIGGIITRGRGKEILRNLHFLIMQLLIILFLSAVALLKNEGFVKFPYLYILLLYLLYHDFQYRH